MFRLKVFCLLLFVMLAFTGCRITINTASDTPSAALYIPPTDVSDSTQPSSFCSDVSSTTDICIDVPDITTNASSINAAVVMDALNILVYDKEKQ